MVIVVVKIPTEVVVKRVEVVNDLVIDHAHVVVIVVVPLHHRHHHHQHLHHVLMVVAGVHLLARNKKFVHGIVVVYVVMKLVVSSSI